MLALLLKEYGGPEQFAIAEVARPVAARGEVLVRIKASSVNQVDIKIREGLSIGPALPAILGADLAGIVEEIGPGVSGFEPGDEVYGCAGGVKGQGGTLAEFIAADARLLAPKPKSLSFREAAALPLVSITAWETIERARVRKGETVLVQGGVGGVGHIAVQLARQAGAVVSAAVGSEADFQIARQLGADEVFNFRAGTIEDFVERVTGNRGFDVVIDTVGGENLVKSFAATAIAGRVATINSRASVDLGGMHAKALSLHVVFMLLPMLNGAGRERHGVILREIAAMADAGGVRPLVDPTPFRLADAADAHCHLTSGKARGKVVIEMD